MTSAERPDDELANVITHGAAFLLSIPAAVYLLWLVADCSPAIRAACDIYAATLLLTFGSSMLSHAFHDIERRKWFRTLDQASIFLLMAGTYTPFGVALLDHGWWQLLHVVMWLCAAAGVARCLQVRDLSGPDKSAFGVMGCLPVAGFGEMARQAPPGLLPWLYVGGACFGVGAIFLALSSRVRYAHAVWHLLVIAGCACQYRAILLALEPASR